MPRALPALLAALLLAGCLGAAPPGSLGTNPEGSGTASPRLQGVALLDSGINPYQEAFAASPGFEERLNATVNGNYTTVVLSNAGTLEDRMKADAEVLQGLKTGQLYHFAGTRILAISFLNRTNVLAVPERPIYDDYGHGTQTSSLVARADPDAIILMAEIEAQPCDSGRCTLDPSASEALKWVAAQPWVDVISASVAFPGAPPDSPAVHPEMQTFLDASRTAAASGKLVVVAAGNYPHPTLTGYTAGPPWVIAVGGYEPANHGEVAVASKGMDVIANYTAQAADPRATHGTGWTAGTSFSTPTVAGTLSRALGIVRADLTRHGMADLRLRAVDADARQSAKAFRDAMNASAEMISATDYNPEPTPENDTIFGRIVSPAVPILTPEQQGWGVVREGLAEAIAAKVISGDLSMPAAKGSAASAQAHWQAAREAYWS